MTADSHGVRDCCLHQTLDALDVFADITRVRAGACSQSCCCLQGCLIRCVCSSVQRAVSDGCVGAARRAGRLSQLRNPGTNLSLPGLLEGRIHAAHFLSLFCFQDPLHAVRRCTEREERCMALATRSASRELRSGSPVNSPHAVWCMLCDAGWLRV